FSHVIITRFTLTLSFTHSAPPRTHHSFPTRRSSDLVTKERLPRTCPPAPSGITRFERIPSRRKVSRSWLASGSNSSGPEASQDRSEEHTSELQSRGHLVCRLLLEKKKKTTPHPPAIP